MLKLQIPRLAAALRMRDGVVDPAVTVQAATTPSTP
jgi:hypothetical protein